MQDTEQRRRKVGDLYLRVRPLEGQAEYVTGDCHACELQLLEHCLDDGQWSSSLKGGSEDAAASTTSSQHHSSHAQPDLLSQVRASGGMSL